jgi:hypothetical protein
MVYSECAFDDLVRPPRLMMNVSGAASQAGVFERPAFTTPLRLRQRVRIGVQIRFNARCHQEHHP